VDSTLNSLLTKIESRSSEIGEEAGSSRSAGIGDITTQEDVVVVLLRQCNSVETTARAEELEEDEMKR
jgi:hypothetical protein